VAQTAKGGQMTVGDPSLSERFRESMSVELRIRPDAAQLIKAPYSWGSGTLTPRSARRRQP